tara:strand:+ start:102 stop:545 length:444 start_codon:yes stop_codon:yes gene_type:complete
MKFFCKNILSGFGLAIAITFLINCSQIEPIDKSKNSVVLNQEKQLAKFEKETPLEYRTPQKLSDEKRKLVIVYAAITLYSQRHTELIQLKSEKFISKSDCQTWLGKNSKLLFRSIGRHINSHYQGYKIALIDCENILNLSKGDKNAV